MHKTTPGEDEILQFLVEQFNSAIWSKRCFENGDVSGTRRMAADGFRHTGQWAPRWSQTQVGAPNPDAQGRRGETQR